MFKNAYAPHDLPKIEYGASLRPFADLGLDQIPAEINAAWADKILNQVLGDEDETKAGWKNAHGDERTAKIMYCVPLKAAARQQLQQMRRDERGYFVVDTTWTP